MAICSKCGLTEDEGAEFRWINRTTISAWCQACNKEWREAKKVKQEQTPVKQSTADDGAYKQVCLRLPSYLVNELDFIAECEFTNRTAMTIRILKAYNDRWKVRNIKLARQAGLVIHGEDPP